MQFTYQLAMGLLISVTRCFTCCIPLAREILSLTSNLGSITGA